MDGLECGVSAAYKLAAPEDAPEVLPHKRVQHFVVHRAEVGAHLCVDHCCEVAEDLLEACGRRCAEARRSKRLRSACFSSEGGAGRLSPRLRASASHRVAVVSGRCKA